jgi:sugar phosphate isomerase/epimerase
MNPLLVHINYFEQGQSLERACRITRELGADGIEFRRKPPRYAGSDLDYLDEVSRALDKHPLPWVSFGSPGVDLMLPEPSQREKELAAAEKFYGKAAARFPLRVVNAFTGALKNSDPDIPGSDYCKHGSAVATESQWQSAVEGVRHLGAMAGRLGFRFAVETHPCYLHDTLESTLRLVEEAGSSHAGLLWDHVNLLLFPKPPGLDEAIRLAGENLLYVHLKNLLFQPSRFLAMSSLSGGIVNIREQLALLKNSGYTGPICVESPRSGDREWFLREDLAYLRELMEE